MLLTPLCDCFYNEMVRHQLLDENGMTDGTERGDVFLSIVWVYRDPKIRGDSTDDIIPVVPSWNLLSSLKIGGRDDDEDDDEEDGVVNVRRNIVAQYCSSNDFAASMRSLTKKRRNPSENPKTRKKKSKWPKSWRNFEASK